MADIRMFILASRQYCQYAKKASAYKMNSERTYYPQPTHMEVSEAEQKHDPKSFRDIRTRSKTTKDVFIGIHSWIFPNATRARRPQGWFFGGTPSIPLGDWGIHSLTPYCSEYVTINLSRCVLSNLHVVGTSDNGWDSSITVPI